MTENSLDCGNSFAAALICCSILIKDSAVRDKIIVHEENIEITETGARYLSLKAEKDLTVI